MARKDETNICSEVWEYLATPLPEVELSVLTPEQVDEQVEIFVAMYEVANGATIH